MTCVRTLMSGHFIFASVFAGGLDFHAIGGAFHKGNTLRQDTCLFKTSTKGFPRALPVHAVSNSGVACRFRCCSNFLQTCKNDSQTFGAYLSRNLFASLSLDTFASSWPLPSLDRRDAISAIVPNCSMSSLSRCCKGSRPLHMTLVRKPLDFFEASLTIGTPRTMFAMPCWLLRWIRHSPPHCLFLMLSGLGPFLLERGLASVLLNVRLSVLYPFSCGLVAPFSLGCLGCRARFPPRSSLAASGAASCLRSSVSCGSTPRVLSPKGLASLLCTRRFVIGVIRQETRLCDSVVRK